MSQKQNPRAARWIASWIVALTLGVGCGPTEKPAPTAAEGAAYFGLSDGAVFTFESSAGQDEVHTLTLQSDDGTHIFQSVARTGGFVVPDRTMTLEVTGESIFFNRFNDCVNRCGIADPSIILFNWPVKARSRKSTDTTLQWSDNGVDEDPVLETHAFQVGELIDVEVPAGAYTGYEVFWTRTRGEEISSARWILVPEVGVVLWETFDGITLELKKAP